MIARRRAAVWALAGACVLQAPGCDVIDRIRARVDSSADETPAPQDEPEPVAVVATPDPPAPKPSTPAAPEHLPPLLRAKKKLPFAARGATHLGFNLSLLTGMHALAAAIEVPSWAAESSAETRRLRDDDLRTAWTCELDPYRPCVVGAHLTGTAQLQAVRLYAAAEGKAFDKHPRIAKLRVHTDAGWVDVELPDGADYGYIVFGKPVDTTSLSLEVLATHGPKRGELWVAELELFGLGGVAREPLELDPARIVVQHDGPAWTSGRDRWDRGPSFLEAVADDGSHRRIMPGTAAFGRGEDRIVLIESLGATDCRIHRGEYYLLDRTTRVPAPVGDLGGLGGQVFRKLDGLGFVNGYVDDVTARLAGVVLEGDTLRHRRTQRLAGVEGPATLDEWAMERQATPRGGAAMNRPPGGCTLGGDDTMTVFAQATGTKAPDTPAEWMICELGGGRRAFLSDHGPCGKSWEIVVLDGSDRPVLTRRTKRRGARLRVRRWSDEALFVEVGGEDDVVQLLRVTATAVMELGATEFAASPPQACRKRCDDALHNPSAP
jgi:hypothetical protein